MKKIGFIIFPLLVFFVACEEDLNVKLPGSTDKIVIEGSIENGKYPQVLISKNVALFSSISGTNLSDFLVLDAKVYVSNGFITDTLALTIDSASSLGVVYKGSAFTGVVGQNYYLTVIAEGKTYTAVTTITPPIALDSVWFQTQPPSDSLGYAWANLKEPSGLGNNYRWFAMRQGKDRRFIAPFGATFDDKFIDGKDFNFAYSKGYDPTDLNNNNNQEPQEEVGYYHPGDNIIVKFCTLDRASKDFYTTFEAALGNNGNPFASPVTVLSNINGGGLGVWCGYGVTYDTIHVPL